MLTLAILGLITVLMYYAAERVHEVETDVVPMTLNESQRYEIHNRTVIRGSRSRRSARRFSSSFFGLLPAAEGAELWATLAPWRRGSSSGAGGRVANEADDDLSRETIELPKSNRRGPSSAIDDNNDDHRSSSLDKDDEWSGRRRLPQGNDQEGSSDRVVVGIVPKIKSRNLSIDEEVVDQRTVAVDHVEDDHRPRSDEDDDQDQLRSKRKTAIYSREDVSYVLVRDCVDQPATRLVPPWQRTLPGGFNKGYPQNYRIGQPHHKQRHHRPQEPGRVPSMYKWRVF